MSIVRLLTDLDGRIGRVRFWLGSVIVALVLLGVRHAAPLLADRHDAATIIAFANAFALFPLSVLAAKRAVDRGSAPVFGILLVCAIVLPKEFGTLLPLAWEPSLTTITLIAWAFALVDLGLMPAARPSEPLAESSAGAKGSAWTSLPNTPPPHSIRSTPSH